MPLSFPIFFKNDKNNQFFTAARVACSTKSVAWWWGLNLARVIFYPAVFVETNYVLHLRIRSGTIYTKLRNSLQLIPLPKYFILGNIVEPHGTYTKPDNSTKLCSLGTTTGNHTLATCNLIYMWRWEGESERGERINRNDSTAQHIGQHFESR